MPADTIMVWESQIPASTSFEDTESLGEIITVGADAHTPDKIYAFDRGICLDRKRIKRTANSVRKQFSKQKS